MTLNDWHAIYNSQSEWVIRMSTYKHRDLDEKTCFSLLLELHNFEKEFIDTFFNDTKRKLNVKYKDWFDICHKYIQRYREENNHIKAEFLFQLWIAGNNYFPRHKDPLNPYILCRDITDEELKYANTYLVPNSDIKKDNLILYSNKSKVLKYRGLELIIDDVWSCAHILHEGKDKYFSLDWDWWFPIDEFLDLEKDWNIKND